MNATQSPRVERPDVWCRLCHAVDVPGYEGGGRSMLCAACDNDPLTQTPIQSEVPNG